MEFNFNITAGASQSTSSQLEGNKIHEVKFTEALVDDITAKDGTVYKVLKLRFSNSEGMFEHTVFQPRPEDAQRRENTAGDGTKYMSPSRVEDMMMLFKHAIDAIVPEIGRKIDSGEQQINVKGWDNLRKSMAEILNQGKGVETKIKLMKNKQGYPTFPGFFTGLDRDTKAPYVRNNFIGNRVAFSSWEANRIKQAEAATPTAMADDLMSFEEPAKDESLNLDFEIGNL